MRRTRAGPAGFGSRVAQPLFLGQLIRYFTPGSGVTKEAALWYAGAVVLCSGFNIVAIHPYMMAILHMGMKIRVACCSLVYRKSLRLSKTALGETTVGQVVNLLANDVNRFDVAVIFVHYLWIGPLETVVASYFMYQEVGVSALFGIASLLLFIPLQGENLCLERGCGHPVGSSTSPSCRFQVIWERRRRRIASRRPSGRTREFV